VAPLATVLNLTTAISPWFYGVRGGEHCVRRNRQDMGTAGTGSKVNRWMSNMVDVKFLNIDDIEPRVCSIAAARLNLCASTINPGSRLIEDLHCDSLDLFELLLALEDAFDVTIPGVNPNPIFQAVFTRQGFCLSDVAETIYLQQGTGKPKRTHSWRGYLPIPETPLSRQFCQLSGRWNREREMSLFERIGDKKTSRKYRRRSDGMRCITIPAVVVEIGTDRSSFNEDCNPKHMVPLDAFLIDAEPVSTTAYCRFLNTIEDVQHHNLLDWFLLTDSDDRTEHVLHRRDRCRLAADLWMRKMADDPGSWYGANAYSLWANKRDWRSYRSDEFSFLPTEAQWEYAARGAEFRLFPVGR